MRRRTPFLTIVFLILLALLLHRVYQQDLWAAVILGIVLVVVGVWGMVKAPNIWVHFVKDYKKLSAKDKKLVQKPDKVYYYINRYILFPLLILCGIFSWYVAYLIHITGS